MGCRSMELFRKHKDPSVALRTPSEKGVKDGKAFDLVPSQSDSEESPNFIQKKLIPLRNKKLENVQL